MRIGWKRINKPAPWVVARGPADCTLPLRVTRWPLSIGCLVERATAIARADAAGEAANTRQAPSDAKAKADTMALLIQDAAAVQAQTG